MNYFEYANKSATFLDTYFAATLSVICEASNSAYQLTANSQQKCKWQKLRSTTAPN